MAFIETDLMTMSPAYIKYGEVGTTTELTKSIVGVLADATLTEEAPEQSTVDHLFSDSPLDTVDTLGAFTLTFTIAKYSKDEIVDMYGATYDEVSGEIFRPTSVASVNKKLEMGFNRGFEKITLYNAKIVANWDFADMKTAPAGLVCTCTALIDTTVADKLKSVGFKLRTAPVAP